MFSSRSRSFRVLGRCLSEVRKDNTTVLTPAGTGRFLFLLGSSAEGRKNESAMVVEQWLALGFLCLFQEEKKTWLVEEEDRENELVPQQAERHFLLRDYGGGCSMRPKRCYYLVAED